MDYYQVGAITQTHGVRGEVKVFPMTDDINRFKNMKDLILDTGKEKITLEVTSVRPQKNLVILKFKDYICYFCIKLEVNSRIFQIFLHRKN